MKKKTRLLNLLIVAALFLGACNLPSGNNENAVSTAAAQTLEALLSATPIPGAATASFTPLAIPATLTTIPSPAFTNTPVPTATSNCNGMKFESDVTIPDGTIIAPGQAFTKTWRLKNIGTCAWTPSYAIVFSSGNALNGPATQALTSTVNPGQSIDISVNLTAPATSGDYTSNWKLRDASGILFGQFYVQIKAQIPPTATSAWVPLFAVTSVSFTNVGGCGGFTTTANITANGPGNVTLHWIRSDGATPPVPPAVVFAAAGTQSVSISWNTTASGTHWFDVYIDTPNNQQFGRASFTCP